MHDVRGAVAQIMEKYDDEYWLDKDTKGEFPLDRKLFSAQYLFCNANAFEVVTRDLAAGGWLGICMPEEYGGSAMGISEAAVMMQTISESGGGLTGASWVPPV